MLKKKIVSRQKNRFIVPLILLGSFIYYILFWRSEEISDEEIQKISKLYAKKQQQLQQKQRENAAFVVLARNDDMAGIRDAMAQLEDRFNHKFNYPYVFLNDEPFDDRFKEFTTGLASGETYYGTIDSSMWGYPDFIDQEKASKSRKEMTNHEIPYGGPESYRHMCRFQSGFFFRHPLLDQFDYYWRVEPDVRFSCDVDYDPFKIMRERDLKYGFTITLYEYELTIPTLWKTVKDFVKEHPEHIIPYSSSDSLIDFISEDNGIHIITVIFGVILRLGH